MNGFPSFVLVLAWICKLQYAYVAGENQICGYNGESLVCCAGYRKDDQGECTIVTCDQNCGVGGQCIRPNTCYCSNGRVASSCPNDNEQDRENTDQIPANPVGCSNNCNGQGICSHGKCKCHLGYSGHSCLDKPIGQCYLSLSRGLCQKSDLDIKVNIEVCCGAFAVAWGDPCKRCPKSRCEKGLMEIDGICRDVNECSIAGLCSRGRCENLEGSYRCICSPGSQFDPRKGDCVKIRDVCMSIPSVCGPGMECQTLPLEGYRCRCKQGYSKSVDQKSCVLKKQNSFNYCAVYGKYVCQHGSCLPDGNNYKCDCIAGYKPSWDKKSCKKDVDYCAIYQNMLCPNGQCVSINNDYMCKCDPGYTLSFDGKKCTSICDLYGPSLCPNAKCIPKTGGEYECPCNEGFLATGKGKQCRRIMNDQSGTPSNIGSSNDNKVTYDVDFCSYDYYRSQCLGGQCTNQRNQYQCECLTGYVSDKGGLSCKKIDSPGSDQMLDMAPSTEFRNYCDRYGSFVCTNGRCLASGSSYQCVCNSGYKKTSDGRNCYDIDECAADRNICDQGTCTNSPGSYQCSCYDGFTIRYLPGGPKCYDRNECEEDRLLCVNGQCTNKWGSYSCVCNVGFVPDSNGKQCVATRYRPGFTDSWHETECKNCVSVCKKINSTSYRCHCPEGLTPVFNTGICVPMTHVVDIEFDVPLTSVTPQSQSPESIKHVFFQLSPGTNKSTVLAQITTMFRNVKIDKCDAVNEPGKDGVRCFFYNVPPK